MPTSDDQLSKKQKQVEELRQQLKAKNEAVARLMREQENDSTASRLDAEAERLKLEIASKDQEIKALGGDPSEVKAPVTRGGSETPKAQTSEKKEG